MKRSTKSSLVVIYVIALFAIYKWPFNRELFQNSLDSYIAPYSDTHINQSAKIASQEFKSITFDPPMRKEAAASSQIAGVLKALKYWLLPPSKAENEFGTWLWTPILQMDDTYMKNVVDGVKKNGIKTIYLSLDSFLDIYTLPKSDKRDSLENKFNDKLRNFISLANKSGVEVVAEGGWRNWAEVGHTYKPFAIAKFVKDFNQENSEKIAGFQYDIEPYLLDSYRENVESQKKILENFVKLVDQTGDFFRDTGIKFEVVVPAFYDGKDSVTPKFSYNGRSDFVFRHLLEILENNPDSSIVIMAYRNQAEGPDGSIDISKNEISTAKWGGYSTKIIIAQETGQIRPPYVTFFHKSRADLLNQISEIHSAYDGSFSFGGIAVHYANSFMALK